MEKSHLFSLAMSGLLMAASNVAMAENAAAVDPKKEVMCYGVNACGGKGACHGKATVVGKDGKNEAVSLTCAGKNGCSGKGATKMTYKDCVDKKGTVLDS